MRTTLPVACSTGGSPAAGIVCLQARSCTTTHPGTAAYPAPGGPGDQGDRPRPGERARLVAQGQRSDDGSNTTLVIIHEENGSWSIHGLGAPGVTLNQTDLVALAESILARSR
jgi:hypothetical protein